MKIFLLGKKELYSCYKSLSDKNLPYGSFRIIGYFLLFYLMIIIKTLYMTNDELYFKLKALSNTLNEVVEEMKDLL